MSEIDRIYDQLGRAFAGKAWHGPALWELLSEVSAERARARPLDGAHSIWDIVLHLTAWKHTVRRRLAGEAVELTPAQDWPHIPDTSEAAWKRALARLEEQHEKLLWEISVLKDGCLRDLVPGKDYNVYFMLHGSIQHDLYHAGQIALLMRAAARTTAA